MINDMTRAAQANAKETDPVEVYCRIKPLGGDSGSCIQILDNTTLALIPPETSVAYKLGTAKENHYTFKYVYGSNASQQQIFDEISLPLVKVCIMYLNLFKPILLSSTVSKYFLCLF